MCHDCLNVREWRRWVVLPPGTHSLLTKFVFGGLTAIIWATNVWSWKLTFTISLLVLCLWQLYSKFLLSCPLLLFGVCFDPFQSRLSLWWWWKDKDKDCLCDNPIRCPIPPTHYPQELCFKVTVAYKVCDLLSSSVVSLVITSLTSRRLSSSRCPQQKGIENDLWCITLGLCSGLPVLSCPLHHHTMFTVCTYFWFKSKLE